MFEGTHTAIVTPMDSKGVIDYDKFRDLIEMQIEGGVDGIVPVGTTGESPALTYKEHDKVIEVAVETVAGRIKVIAGTGSNSTAEAVSLTEHAKSVGADGTLQVTPYYNKPNQDGLIKHFSAVADIGLPVVLYNVPGRSALSIEIATVAELAKHPDIVAVKEAGGSVDRVTELTNVCDLTVLSGDDGLAFPMMSIGAKGVISVASNIVPQIVSDMVRFANAGQWDEARKIHLKYHKLFGDMFVDTNPIPVKSAMAMMGLTEETYRLPLCPMRDNLKAQLKSTMEEAGIL